MTITKTCSKCGKIKPINDFYKRKRSKDGASAWCKKCCSAWATEHYQWNKEKIDEQHAEYRLKNYEQIRAHQKEYYYSEEGQRKAKEYRETHREQQRKREQEWRDKNREYYRKKQNEHYHKNKEKHKEWHKKWRESHKEQIRESSKRYREENREKMNRSKLDKLHSDSIFKLSEQYRNRVQLALKAKEHRKVSKTAEMLGCDLYFFKDYMLATWKKRYGKPWAGEEYNVDHIIPLMSAQTEDDVKRLFHYTNLQLLTPEDNMRKREEDKKKYGASI